MAEGCRCYYSGIVTSSTSQLQHRNFGYDMSYVRQQYSNLFDIAARTSTSLAKTRRIYDSGIVTPRHRIYDATSKKWSICKVGIVYPAPS